MVYKLVRSYYYCSHKNYDPGGVQTEVVATFSSKERADSFLEIVLPSLKKTYPDNSFMVYSYAEVVPHDPDPYKYLLDRQNR